MFKRMRFLFLFAAFTIGTQNLAGQANPDSIRHRNDCRFAQQIVEQGHPANRNGWALGLIISCAEGGQALAVAIKQARNTTDPASLESLVRAGSQLRDSSVYAVALALVVDASAALPARIQGIRLLSAQLNPDAGATLGSYEFYAGAGATGKNVRIDGYTVTSDRANFEGRPLPVDALNETERSMRAVADDPRTPLQLVHAATTIIDEIEGHRICKGASPAECQRRLTQRDESD